MRSEGLEVVVETNTSFSILMGNHHKGTKLDRIGLVFLNMTESYFDCLTQIK